MLIRWIYRTRSKVFCSTLFRFVSDQRALSTWQHLCPRLYGKACRCHLRTSMRWSWPNGFIWVHLLSRPLIQRVEHVPRSLGPRNRIEFHRKRKEGLDGERTNNQSRNRFDGLPCCTQSRNLFHKSMSWWRSTLVFEWLSWKAHESVKILSLRKNEPG